MFKGLLQPNLFRRTGSAGTTVTLFLSGTSVGTTAVAGNELVGFHEPAVLGPDL